MYAAKVCGSLSVSSGIGKPSLPRPSLLRPSLPAPWRRVAGSRVVRQLLPALHQLSQEQDPRRPGRRGARHRRAADDDDGGPRIIIIIIIIIPAASAAAAAAAHDVTRRS